MMVVKQLVITLFYIQPKSAVTFTEMSYLSCITLPAARICIPGDVLAGNFLLANLRERVSGLQLFASGSTLSTLWRPDFKPQHGSTEMTSPHRWSEPLGLTSQAPWGTIFELLLLLVVFCSSRLRRIFILPHIGT